MEKPIILILPVILWLDYYLTIFGGNLKKIKYDEYYEITDYELNPLWKKDVRKLIYFNKKHFILTLVITLSLVIGTQLITINELLFTFITGMFAVFYSIIIGRHFSNIAIFYYLTKNPLSGKIILNQKYVVFISLASIIPILFVSSIIFFVTKSIFVLGGVTGTILAMFIHFYWFLTLSKHR